MSQYLTGVTHCVTLNVLHSRHGHRFIYGKWTEFLCAVDIPSLEDHLGVRVDRVDPSASNMPKHEPLALGAVPNSVVLWQAEPKAQDAERYYNFRYRKTFVT